MGSIGSRFGRNVPLEHTWPEEPPTLLEPNPRLISRELLTRESFEPATTLNLLAGAWIQFEVHDWFSHGDNDPTNAWEIPLEDDDPWPRASDAGRPHAAGSERRAGQAARRSSTADTHWWDGSQVYGSTPAVRRRAADAASSAS